MVKLAKVHPTPVVYDDETKNRKEKKNEHSNYYKSLEFNFY